MSINLKDYVCTVPFMSLEIHTTENYLCCPSWLLKKLPGGIPFDEAWNSNEALEIRESVMDGSYKFCDKTQCPYLSQLDKIGTKGDIGPIYHKSDVPEFIKKNIEENITYMDKGPSNVLFSFDRTCNYKCPSCRVDVVKLNPEQVSEVDRKIDEINRVLSKDITWINVTSSGDPFVSKSFRKFLKEFNPELYPNLENIHLHTNASMWNEKMWNQMPNVHPYVKSCEISIDAGTKDTYENKVRLNGDWDNLISNLKFVNSISSNFYFVKISFVVQDHNYREMKTFLDLMKSIFGKKAKIFFGKINNWGSFKDGEFMLRKIWDPAHPEYNDFLKEFEKIYRDPQVYHNLHEFIKPNRTLI